MKKQYISPDIQMSEMNPIRVVCASITFGEGGTAGLGGGGGSGPVISE